MTPNWRYPTPPVAGAQNIDFAQLVRDGIDVPGQPRQLTLAGVGSMSPGEWTLYFLRRTYLENPDDATPPAGILQLQIQAGTDKGRGELLSMPSTGAGASVQLFASPARGVCWHVGAGAVDASITYLPGSRTRDDSLVSWVAPGRPTTTRMEGRAITVVDIATARPDRLRIPAFARTLRMWMSDTATATFPAVVFYSGPTVDSVFYFPAAAAFTTTELEVMAPLSASHYAFIDPSGAANFVYYQFTLES